nr:hypothetical protein [Acidisphaera sp. L21]
MTTQAQRGEGRGQEGCLAAIRFDKIEDNPCFDCNWNCGKTLAGPEVNQPIQAGWQVRHDAEAIVDEGVQCHLGSTVGGGEVERGTPAS